MTGFKRILVPTDFSEPAERALAVALMLASQFDSKLTILHANWLPALAYAGYAEGVYWPTDDMEKAARKALDDTLARARERYPAAEGLLETAEPSRAILDTARDLGADLIVMGTHGRHGVSRVLLGSVTEKVVRLSPIPVMTIRGKGEPEHNEESTAMRDPGSITR
jgi:universal stress protein A